MTLHRQKNRSRRALIALGGTTAAVGLLGGAYGASGLANAQSPTPTGTATSGATSMFAREGTYEGDFEALNAEANGGEDVTGTATFEVTGDEMRVSVTAEGLAPGMAHLMHIHLGDSCPTDSADTNGDGFMDVVEGLPSYGPILLNLDSDLADGEMNEFPEADGDGGYEYSETVSLDELEELLTTADSDPSDAMATLGANGRLDLTAAHVVIHGVADEDLPASVQSLPGVDANVTLPVACAELTSTSAPGAGGGATTATATATGTRTATPITPSPTATAATTTATATTPGSTSTAVTPTQDAVGGVTPPSSGNTFGTSGSAMSTWLLLGLAGVAGGAILAAFAVRQR